MTFLPQNPYLKPVARELRAAQTDAERLLWSCLRRKQILGIQFYRQKTIGNYIVDFYASAVKLVIELDGSQHYEPDAIENDKTRDAYLNDLGLSVMRFDNNQVKSQLSAVLERIYKYTENFL